MSAVPQEKNLFLARDGQCYARGRRPSLVRAVVRAMRLFVDVLAWSCAHVQTCRCGSGNDSDNENDNVHSFSQLSEHRTLTYDEGQSA